MSNDNEAQGVQPAPTTEATPVGEQPQVEQMTPGEVIRNTDDLKALEVALGWMQAEEETPEQQPEPQPDQSQPAPETPEEVPESAEQAEPGNDQGEGEQKRGGPDRISLKVLEDDDRKLMAQAVDLVREGKAKSVVEAIASLQPAKPTEPAPTAEPEKPQARQDQPAAAADSDVQAITAEIARLRAERKTAIEDYDVGKQTELTEAIEDKILELQAAREAAMVRKTQEAEAERQWSSQVAEVKAKHPESSDPGSDFSQRLKDKLDLAAYRNDPILQNGNYLVLLADKVAEELGSNKPAAATPKPVVVPKPEPTKPNVGTVIPAAAPKPTVSKDQIKPLLAQASIGELEAALWGTKG